MVKKLKANKHVIGRNDHGQIVFRSEQFQVLTSSIWSTILYAKERTSTILDGSCLQKHGRLNVPKGIIRNDERLNIIKA